MLKLIYCFAFTVILAGVKKLSIVPKCISFSGIPQLRKWQGLAFTQFCKGKHNLFKFAKSVPDHQYVKRIKVTIVCTHFINLYYNLF